MSAATAAPGTSAADDAASAAVIGGGVERPGLGRWIGQPLVVVALVAGCLLYVYNADITDVERRTLSVGNLVSLLGQHLFLSVVATVLTCIVAIPLGIGLTRGVMRRFSKPIITVAGFGQAAPAIGLIALGAALIDLGARGAIVALAVYGILPIVANTVTGLDGVDRRLIEAARGMGMSGFGTLVRVELPLALRVIVAGVRTALVLIVGTAALASFVDAGGLGELLTAGIKLQQTVTLVVGAILIAALALLIDWLARLVEIAAAPKGVG